MFDATAAPCHALMQDPAFAAALRLLGQRPVILPGGLMVLHRRIAGLPVSMLPRAAPPADLSDRLRAVGLHRCPLILSPDAPAALPRAIQLQSPRHSALLDLAPPRDARLARLHPKWRNQWRRALDGGLRVSHSALRADPQHPLLRAEDAQRKRRGYGGWPAALTCAFATAAPDQTRLFTAKRRGHVVARMLFLSHGARATYHMGHTTQAGRACHAHNLLLMAAGDWLADRGHISLDLGLLDPRTPGLDRFKLRSGATARPTGGTWLHWHPLARHARA